jgi:hypothetical protein
MPKILNKPISIFGGAYSLAPNGQLAEFGSLAAGAAGYSADPVAIQTAAAIGGTPVWQLGWKAAVQGNNQPQVEDENAAFFVITYLLAYIKQQGICEWDATTVYYSGSWALSNDGLGTAYKSEADNNQNNPLTNTSFWTPVSETITPPPLTSQSVFRAWVTFNGNTGVVLGAYNVSSITKLGTGNYMINIALGVLTGNVGYFADCAKATIGAGQSASIMQRLPGETFNATQFQIHSQDCQNATPLDSPWVTVGFTST